MICDKCDKETNTNFSKNTKNIYCYNCNVEFEKRREELVSRLSDEDIANLDNMNELENGVFFAKKRLSKGDNEKAKNRGTENNSIEPLLNFVLTIASISLLLYFGYELLVTWLGSEEAAIGVMFIGAGYFFPYLIALLRGHLSAGAIFMTVLLLGWTGIGWIVALIWSCTGNTRSNVARRNGL